MEKPSQMRNLGVLRGINTSFKTDKEVRASGRDRKCTKMKWVVREELTGRALTYCVNSILTEAVELGLKHKLKPC